MAGRSPSAARRTLPTLPQFSFGSSKTDKLAVVVQLGSAYCAVGFASEHTPRHIIPASPIIHNHVLCHTIHCRMHAHSARDSWLRTASRMLICARV